MSWNPTLDPICPDAAGVDAIETLIIPRARDLGGFEVRRALPAAEQLVLQPTTRARLVWVAAGSDELMTVLLWERRLPQALERWLRVRRSRGFACWRRTFAHQPGPPNYA